jgi:hypothetical protein
VHVGSESLCPDAQRAPALRRKEDQLAVVGKVRVKVHIIARHWNPFTSGHERFAEWRDKDAGPRGQSSELHPGYARKNHPPTVLREVRRLKVFWIGREQGSRSPGRDIQLLYAVVLRTASKTEKERGIVRRPVIQP